LYLSFDAKSRREDYLQRKHAEPVHDVHRFTYKNRFNGKLKYTDRTRRIFFMQGQDEEQLEIEVFRRESEQDAFIPLILGQH